MQFHFISSQEEPAMFVRTLKLCSAVMFAVALTAASPAVTRAGDDGVVRVKSAYPIGETIARL